MQGSKWFPDVPGDGWDDGASEGAQREWPGHPPLLQGSHPRHRADPADDVVVADIDIGGDIAADA